jgi:hypothetical protein
MEGWVGPRVSLEIVKASLSPQTGIFHSGFSTKILQVYAFPTPRLEADPSPPISAEVKHTWFYTSIPPYVFMA